jgi:hypothetical protein
LFACQQQEESDYKLVQKTLEKLVRIGVDGQVRAVLLL